ncbi:MAG: hypothetical protein JRJ24_00060, partial [Deltaproteobacteria bacterium]|nr:hypothetical protein [Deltaproteobacteria bacterium]
MGRTMAHGFVSAGCYDGPMLSMDKRLLVLFVAAIIVSPACRSSRQAEATDAAKPAKAPVLDKALIEQLNAIGYVSGTSPAGPHEGVTVHNEALAQKGYSFFTSG